KLGERDICDHFLIPEKLYGREGEVQVLLNAFERVAEGNSEMILVEGFSGIGKTAVVHEVHKPIVKNRGYFIKGKFDQFNRNIPFSAFVQAFRSLMGQILSESDAELTHWKTKILEAVGNNGQVLIDVIPELETVIGKQPPVPELSGSEAQNRFNLLFEKFIAVFTTKEHPLVIFLDDLQWADSASLNLMKVLMGDSDRGYLLLLGAYRDNEVFPAHPLMLTLAELAKQEAAISTITLAPLALHHINQLVAESLICTVEQSRLLTKLVHQKTQGNSFFTTQFLKRLYEDKLITFNLDLGYWKCDLVKVRDAALTDDVVEFMASRLQKLPAATQEVLKLAACIGNQFDLETLAIVRESSSEEVASELWNALQEGMILPISEAYKFFQGEIDSAEADRVAVNYRFLHDRVQQAAYSLIPKSQKQVTHLAIGHQLWKNLSESEREEQLFTIVNHFNLGKDLISDRAERYLIARLNLQASQKAKASVAYEASRNYCHAGQIILPPDSWQDDYELSFSLALTMIESEYLNHNLQVAQELFPKTLEKARNLLDRVKVCELQIMLKINKNQWNDAIDLSIDLLDGMGINMSIDPEKNQSEIELIYQEIALYNDKVADLIELPIIEEEEKLMAMSILNYLLCTSYIANPNLFILCVLYTVRYSLKNGYCPITASAYGWYGNLLCGMYGEIEAGYEFGKLALQMIEKFNSRSYATKAIALFNAFIRPWKEPLKNSAIGFLTAIETGLENGDLEYAFYSAVHHGNYLFYSGELLETVFQSQNRYLPIIVKAKYDFHENFIRINKQVIANLIGKNERPHLLQGQVLDGEKCLSEWLQNDLVFLVLCFYEAQTRLAYLFEDSTLAIEAGNQGWQYREGAKGSAYASEYRFYYSLALLDRRNDLTAQDRERLEINKEQLKTWAKFAPANFQHKYDLVNAELCRGSANKIEAIEHYDRAISGAKENGFIQEEALANELFAKFYLDWSFDGAQPNGKEKYAALHMQEAYYCYAQWGAKAKTDALEQRYPQLLQPILESTQQRDPISSASTTSLSTTSSHSQTAAITNISSLLNFSSLLKASQTLSGEIELDRLLSNLMKIILENAGATKGALLLIGEQGLTVDAIATRNNEDLQFDSVHQSIPLEDYPDLPAGLINYVRRTTKTALLDAKTAQEKFAADTYLRRFSPQSLLCFPLLERGNLIGILYLENTLTADAFTRDRVELLDALCAQAAISLNNARLYQQAQQALQDLQEAQLQLVQNEKMATLGNLVAGVAHEINNPVGFIGGNVSAAQEYLQDLLEIIALYQENASVPESIIEEIEDLDLDFIAEDFPKLIASMQTGCERIRNISTSLRTFSRTDTDAKTEFNLHEGIESTLLILKYRLKAHENRPAIEIVKEYGDIPEVKCYAGQINQVFMNLVANAIDALEEGNEGRSFAEITMNPNCITIQTEATSEGVIVSIGDNGKGMPEGVRAKIFEQGFTTKGVGKGTGLGLAIARQIIVEKHGGTLTCHSEPGKGTAFVIKIPLHA
ncbi:AAA family ATPase, partial [Lusitaniella coriacea LEGE 07157]